MTRRLVTIAALVLLFASTALAGSTLANLPHANAPYYHDDADGPISMTTAPDGSLWAVWSYSSGSSVDIAFSRSIGRTWTPPVLLGYDNGRTDLDPRIAFTAQGTPVLSWWQDATLESSAAVVVSFFIEDSWTYPATISDPLCNASNPAFLANGIETSVAFLELDPGTGESSISIAPIHDPDPAGGANGPDPIPTIGVPIGNDPEDPPDNTVTPNGN